MFLQVSKSNLEKDRFTRNLDQLKEKVSTLEETEQIKNKLERETQHLSQELEKYTGIQVTQGDTGKQVIQGDTGSTREYRDTVKAGRYRVKGIWIQGIRIQGDIQGRGIQGIWIQGDRGLLRDTESKNEK